MIVPIRYTNQVAMEKEEDIVPFFVDIKGEKIANITATIKKKLSNRHPELSMRVLIVAASEAVAAEVKVQS